MSQSQREAVYAATMNVLADQHIPFDDGQKPTASQLINKEMRASVIAVVCAGFCTGEINLSEEATKRMITDDGGKSLKEYTSGLVSNWYRKDPRLNGNEKYEAKNPGSRAGAGDDQLKALKTLRAAKADDVEAVAAIDKAIEQRQSELKVTKKVALTEEQINLIPEALRAKLGL